MRTRDKYYIQRIVTYFCWGSIAVKLTSNLTGLNLLTFLVFELIAFSFWLNSTSRTGGHLHSDAYPYKASILYSISRKTPYLMGICVFEMVTQIVGIYTDKRLPRPQ